MNDPSIHLNIKKGDVYWVNAVGRKSGSKIITHPYVVVQDDVINRSRIETVVACGITSNLKRATEPGNVLLEKNEANLSRQSVVVVSQVEAINKSDLGELIGNLGADRIKQILDGLRFQQKSFFDR